MDSLDSVPLQSSPNLLSNSFKNHDMIIEPGELLDETWFFGNLLDGKPRMLRCYSDPCPSSKTSSSEDDDDMFPGKSMEETFSSINRIPDGKRALSLRVPGTGLMKTPSLPAKQQPDSENTNDPRIQEPWRNSLLRAPSLPSFAEKEEFQDEESEFSMGKLIRQASLNQPKLLSRHESLSQSKILIRQGSLNLNQSKPLTRQGSLNQPKVLPPRQTAKGVTRSCSISTIPKQNPRKKSEPESINPSSNCNSGETKPRYASNQPKIRKSHSSVDTEELKGLKNLGLKVKDDEKMSRRRGDTSSEKWLAKSFGAPLQSGAAASKKSAEDMKAQIRFWARAVASNVRQEC
ncbi:PREDICTED: uncharacterized protein LOC109150352 isoform X2 [Ipomoea nil]|uniref:uncharacterized protein LOC109150352 isoform X2 n=1 Tax=Ipomoea nil TaxID=35883 RepID=UPI00090184D1|nr:PREDICTED: uncharacterized protein LOC109150352 isoform X2 [Ipomoea nil]